MELRDEFKQIFGGNWERIGKAASDGNVIDALNETEFDDIFMDIWHRLHTNIMEHLEENCDDFGYKSVFEYVSDWNIIKDSAVDQFVIYRALSSADCDETCAWNILAGVIEEIAMYDYESENN